mgnify:CR=1 FL=1
MSIYNRRNAAVGYLAIKVMRRALRRKRRRGVKVAAYVGLGLVSAGILAAALAIVLRRKHASHDEVAYDDEIVGEVVSAPEPVPAT